MNHDFGVVFVELVAGGDPGNDVLAGTVGVVEVKRLVEELVAGARSAARQVGVEGVEILHLTGADASVDAVEDQRAVARHVFQPGGPAVAPATGAQPGGEQQESYALHELVPLSLDRRA